MKKFLFCLFSISLFLSSCQDEPIIIDAELHHDGENFTAPFFDAMSYTCAARFSGGITSEYTGLNLTEVEFYFNELPEQVVVQIYGQRSSEEPGVLFYEADVSTSLTPNSWNQHTLTSPVEILGQDLWIALSCSQVSRKQTMGCDAGPSVIGGDMIFTETNNQWETFEQLTTTESINWNIRGQVSE